MVRLSNPGTSFITRGKPITDEEIKGTLRGLEYLRQEDYRIDNELVNARVLDNSQLSLDNCL